MGKCKSLHRQKKFTQPLLPQPQCYNINIEQIKFYEHGHNSVYRYLWITNKARITKI